MERQKNAFSGLVVTWFALALAACGSEKNAPSADVGKQIATLAQSINEVTFDYDSKAKRLQLFFQVQGSKSTESSEVAEENQLVSLLGQVGEDSSAELISESSPEFSAKAKCSDQTCSAVEFVIARASGSLAGTATVRVRSYPDTGRVISQSGEIRSDAHVNEMIRSMDRHFSRDELIIAEVVGTGHKFFEMAFDFSNQGRGLSKADDDYFDKKRAVISGRIGTNVDVRLVRESVKGSYSEFLQTTRKVNVFLESALPLLRVEFETGDEGGVWVSLWPHPVSAQ